MVIEKPKRNVKQRIFHLHYYHKSNFFAKVYVSLASLGELALTMTSCLQSLRAPEGRGNLVDSSFRSE